jgi:hypothetical protein
MQSVYSVKLSVFSQLLDIDNLLRGVGRGLGEYFLGAGDGTVSFGVQVFWLKSVCVSPSGDQSIGNISKIDSNLTESLTDSSTGSKEKLSQLSNQKLSASHNLLQLDDKSTLRNTV